MEPFYLAPSFDELEPEDLFLLGFYADNMIVSDGLLWWRFFGNDLPLLSYLAVGEQLEAIRMLAESHPAMKRVLRAYGDLVSHGIVRHAWLSERSWALTEKPADSSAVRAAITAFNAAFRERRPDIARGVRERLVANPGTPAYEAIRQARAAAAEEVIASTRRASRDRDLGHDAVQRRVLARFREHLDQYVRTDRFAARWVAGARLPEAPYSGDLADVASDLALNGHLVPVFTSTRAGQFVHDWSAAEIGDRGSRGAMGARAFHLGFRVLNQLPHLRFTSIEDALIQKERLSEELHCFRLRMNQLARMMVCDPYTLDADDEVRAMIDEQVQPAIEQLRRSIRLARMASVREAGAAAAGLGVAAAVGVPTAGLITLALAASAFVGSSVLRYVEEREKVEANPQLRGVSLVLRLPRTPRTNGT